MSFRAHETHEIHLWHSETLDIRSALALPDLLWGRENREILRADPRLRFMRFSTGGTVDTVNFSTLIYMPTYLSLLLLFPFFVLDIKRTVSTVLFSRKAAPMLNKARHGKRKSTVF